MTERGEKHCTEKTVSWLLCSHTTPNGENLNAKVTHLFIVKCIEPLLAKGLPE